MVSKERYACLFDDPRPGAIYYLLIIYKSGLINMILINIKGILNMSKNTPPNGPSTTGKPSGGGRGNNTPKGK